MKKLHGFQYGNYMIVYLVIAIVIDLVPFLCCSILFPGLLLCFIKW